MYELIQVDDKTYYINFLAKIGIYKINDKDVCLIDSGNDKDAGRRINKYHLSFIYDVKEYLNTLDKVKNLTVNCLFHLMLSLVKILLI